MTYVATIELETDDDFVTVSAPDGQFGGEGIELDRSPKGVYSTAFTTRTVSGAFQIGGRPAGHEFPIRKITTTYHLYDMGQGIEATISRFRKLWRLDRGVTWRYTTAISGLRWLTLHLASEIDFSPEKDWNLDGYAKAVVQALAYEPMYESAADQQSWSNPSAGTNTGWLSCWNPTDQKLFLEWSLDPATEWQYADFSFGQEKKYRRTVGEDADRMIITPALTQRLSVMADPVMDTYIMADGSNGAGLFNGVEPLYWVPPYTGTETDPVMLPVICNGAKDATVTLTMRRLWSAEAGVE